jgi:hypothetical protein
MGVGCRSVFWETDLAELLSGNPKIHRKALD